ncbi:signal peptidase II [Liberiplasma polymorphum]|uniref:signal peptidase II n=1 Tax=Liberiplasma polymorphum TaxID=3374570 RepID=UPI0037722953
MKKDYKIATLIMIGLIALDQLTKWIIVWTIPYNFNNPMQTPSYAVIPNFMYITHHHNDGAAWGMFSGQMVFLIAITLLALSLFAYLFKDVDLKQRKFYSYAVILLIAGTLGNFIDRLFLGYVIDFIDVYIFTYNFPIFNVADSALTIGMILFAVDVLILEPKRVKEREK